MINYNKRLDEVFYQYSRKVAESAVDDWEKHEALTEFTEIDMANHYTEAKQALTSLIKELVAEAKPEVPEEYERDDALSIGFTRGTEYYYDAISNLLKTLEKGIE